MVRTQRPPAGWYRGVCVDVQAGRLVTFVWEVEVERQPGYRWIVARQFEPTLAPGSELRLFLELWQNHRFSPRTLQRGLPAEPAYLGRQALLFLAPSSEGPYLDVLSAVAPPRSLPPLVPDGFYVRKKHRRRRRGQPSVETS